MTFGVEIRSASGRPVVMDGDSGFANPVTRGFGTVTTTRYFNSSDPTYSYVACSMSLPLTGYDPAIHALSYGVSMEDAETLNVNHVYFNLSKYGAFSLSVSGNTLNLSYRNPASGYATIYDTGRWAYSVKFNVMYEVHDK